MNSKTLLSKYKATIAYIVTIVLVNMLFSYLPFINFFGNMVSPADAIVGAIYIARDFSQREIGHRVVVAMALGALLSYLMAAPMVASASVAAFLVGETVDWSIFTWTRKPLSERLLWSAIISTPIDTAVFLWLLNDLTAMEFLLMTIGKVVGVVLIWWLWQRKQVNNNIDYPSMDVA